MAYTIAQCDEKIAELEAALDELATLPTRGHTGKTAVDLSGADGRIQDRLDTWKMRRAALLNGGEAPRLRRSC